METIIIYQVIFINNLIDDDNDQAINILQQLEIEDDLKPPQNKNKADKIEEMYKSIENIMKYEDLEPLKERIEKDSLVQGQFQFYSSYFELEDRVKASVVTRELIMYYKSWIKELISRLKMRSKSLLKLFDMIN